MIYIAVLFFVSSYYIFKIDVEQFFLIFCVIFFTFLVILKIADELLQLA